MSADKAIQETVVLVHGLWMRGWVMAWLGWQLRRCGFRTVVFSYPSVRGTLSQNALRLSHFVAGLDAPRIHFMGHSLGGLVLLQMLATHPDPRTGRVVLVGCPYRASFAASKLARKALGRCLIGRSVQQWLGQPAPECAERYEVGVIAGCKPLGAGRLIGGVPQPNDGVVVVEETALPGASDQIMLNVCHSGMLISDQVARQACAFLRHGHFLHDMEAK
ncbi:MAG: alpha/beta hydrolase [Burkholderiales bacterium]|nr:alpha/beta hydrolase [Burkholderiales bacterium]